MMQTSEQRSPAAAILGILACACIALYSMFYAYTIEERVLRGEAEVATLNDSVTASKHGHFETDALPYASLCLILFNEQTKTGILISKEGYVLSSVPSRLRKEAINVSFNTDALRSDWFRYEVAAVVSGDLVILAPLGPVPTSDLVSAKARFPVPTCHIEAVAVGLVGVLDENQNLLSIPAPKRIGSIKFGRVEDLAVVEELSSLSGGPVFGVPGSVLLGFVKSSDMVIGRGVSLIEMIQERDLDRALSEAAASRGSP